jgi:Na+/H+ antiporter NhaD/arsenite permease-like protein
MTPQEWAAIAVFVAAYVLIALERVPRAAAAAGGAAGMVVIGATDADAAFYAEETGVDWNVLFLLLGMMIIVGVLGRTGLFEYLGDRAVRRYGSSPFRLLVILSLLTAMASAGLDNVTTVLLVVPITLAVCERIAVSPIPFLIAVALASNIGGAATLIGDPPNIIVASRADLTFNDFLIHMAPIVVVLLAVFVLLSRLLFAAHLAHDPTRAADPLADVPPATITDPRLLRRAGVVLVLVLVGFVFHGGLGAEPSVIAMLGAGAALLVSSAPVQEVVVDVEWETLAFFAGLFVMVGALVNTGVIEDLAHAITTAVEDRWLLAATGLLFGSAVLSAVIDNIPYVATMAPLVDELVTSADGAPGADSLWWSLLLGADLGGNATAVGASANVIVIGLAAKAGHHISFWRFTRYGLVVAAVTVTLCWPYIWLRYFVLGG